jgi:hypothetical protein
MTKKLTLTFFVAIYLTSLIAGLSFAGIRQAKAITQASSTPTQSSWIMLHVDDMTIEQPKIVSVWAMFLTFSPGPQVFFKPLYAFDASSNKYPHLGKVFTVSADRTISQDFIKELNRLIPHQSGMVIMDDIGYEAFTDWFTTPAITHESQPFVPQTGFTRIDTFKGESWNYVQICKTLENTAHPSLTDLPWRKLLPNHLVAYPTFQSLTSLWKRLVLAEFDAHCEVIQVQ